MAYRVRARCVLLLLFVAIGCNQSGKDPATGKVTGTITVDGELLSEGKITFSCDGQVPKQTTITNGKYELDALVGNNRVVFAVYKQTANPVTAGPGADQPQLENSLPRKYHADSSITFEVKPGSNTFDYKIETK